MATVRAVAARTASPCLRCLSNREVSRSTGAPWMQYLSRLNDESTMLLDDDAVPSH